MQKDFSNLNIVKFQLTDLDDLLDKIIQIDQSDIKHSWPENRWSDLLIKKNYEIYLLYDKESLMGFALFYLSLQEELSHLLKFVIDIEYQNKGNGHFLLDESLKGQNNHGLRKCFLEVETSNLPAIIVYERLGFFKVGTARHFYGHSRDAYRMLKNF